MIWRPAALSVAYTRARPRLVRIAYAVLGSYSEAEDVVSECWLTLVVADGRDPVRDVDAWATVAVARAALDTLRSARVRRELYVGPWLPEPVVSISSDGQDPADRVTLIDTVSYALLVVLEALTPAERTAWVLHDVFGMPFTDVADTVGRTPLAVRQLASRARKHVQAHTPRVDVDMAEHAATVTRFLAAAAGGDLTELVQALDPDVILTSDGGGEVSTALHPIVGSSKVTRFLHGVAAQIADTDHLRVIGVNRAPGLGVYDEARCTTVISFTTDRARVTRIDIIRAPSKLPRPA